MLNYCVIIFFDFDGILLDVKLKIIFEVVKVMNVLKENNVFFVIVIGCIEVEIYLIMEDVGIIFVVIMNGFFI